MVVGDGMLATAFIKAGTNTGRHIIFASGVSNSRETDPDEFKKEADLLLSYAGTGLTLIYFSTVSVCDDSMRKSPYIQHKLNIEKIIPENFTDYMILRLPNVVGKSDNPNTLTNFLYFSLVSNRQFNLYMNATRYLIDLDDVVKLTSLFIQKAKGNLKINVVLNNKIPVPRILKMLSEITGLHGNYLMLAEGSDYEIDNEFAADIIGKEPLQVDPEKYNFNLLKKYYGNP